jgi:hypothetical protein
MTQFTSELPDSVDPVKPGEISPRYTIVRAVGYLAAWVGVVSVCAVPYGYLSVSHGSWNTGSAQFDFGPVLLAIYLTAALAASVLGICAGVASGGGKPWSRTGMILYADLSIVLAIVGFLPFCLFVLRTPVMDIGLRHAIELLVVLKFWIVELPLSIAILYWFTRPNLTTAYQHPEPLAPDRSQR